MDASQYKDYVLVLLFIKYISDKYAGVPYAPIKIPAGASFSDMVALKGRPDIGDKINTDIIGPLAETNRLSDMPDFNDDGKLGSGKEKVDRLTNLIAIFENKNLDFSRNRADGDDILGDAYEYLMRHFATESGKSKGQFYTPAEVSRIMARIIGIREAKTTASTTVYDPTCGSGSLLLKVADEARTPVTLEGQEKDVATAGLARMNMFLHDNPTHYIHGGSSTLAAPFFTVGGTLKTYDYVVANPPFSDKRWSTGFDPHHDEFDRFASFGVPPAKQGDYAYLLHIVRSLKKTGKGACILPHGVLFRGNAEAEIRRNLIRKGYIKGIIGLPPNLFYGTGIPACIVVIDKLDAQNRKGIFMIDASAGFAKDGSKNRLRSQDIHRIVDVFTNQIEVPKYSRMVSVDEIEHKNEFNLNLPRYIDSRPLEDIQDIDGHLQGGIPEHDIDALGRYWSVCPDLRHSLFKPNRDGYVDLTVEKSDVKTAIYDHPEFAAFTEGMRRHFTAWQDRITGELKNVETGFHPKELIHSVGEDILAHYQNRPLIDPYDVYQRLMDYWDETMQDDCYLIAADGWKAEPYRVIEKDKKGNDKDKGWACDLVPKPLIVARYFAAEQAAIDDLTAQIEDDAAKLAELEEENGDDEGALSTVANRTDALIARQEAIIALLEQVDAESFGNYKLAVIDQEKYRGRLNDIAADPRIQNLASAKGKVTLAAVNARLREQIDQNERGILETYKLAISELKKAQDAAREHLKKGSDAVQKHFLANPEHEDFNELGVLEEYLRLTDLISGLKKNLKEAENELDALAYAKYRTLTEGDVKQLVVDDKWLASLSVAINGEVGRVSQQLTGRVKELADRYETPLPKIIGRVAELETKVNGHLEQMGYSWM